MIEQVIQKSPRIEKLAIGKLPQSIKPPVLQTLKDLHLFDMPSFSSTDLKLFLQNTPLLTKLTLEKLNLNGLGGLEKLKIEQLSLLGLTNLPTAALNSVFGSSLRRVNISPCLHQAWIKSIGNWNQISELVLEDLPFSVNLSELSQLAKRISSHCVSLKLSNFSTLKSDPNLWARIGSDLFSGTLSFLDLSRSQLSNSDISALFTKPNSLEKLNLQGSSISTLTFLSQCSQLVELNIKEIDATPPLEVVNHFGSLLKLTCDPKHELVFRSLFPNLEICDSVRI